jgi:hypothetical protein
MGLRIEGYFLSMDVIVCIRNQLTALDALKKSGKARKSEDIWDCSILPAHPVHIVPASIVEPIQPSFAPSVELGSESTMIPFTNMDYFQTK